MGAGAVCTLCKDRAEPKPHLATLAQGERRNNRHEGIHSGWKQKSPAIRCGAMWQHVKLKGSKGTAFPPGPVKTPVQQERLLTVSTSMPHSSSQCPNWLRKGWRQPSKGGVEAITKFSLSKSSSKSISLVSPPPNKKSLCRRLQFQHRVVVVCMPKLEFHQPPYSKNASLVGRTQKHWAVAKHKSSPPLWVWPIISHERQNKI